MNLIELCKKFNIEIESIEIKDFGTILRTTGIKKLDALREHMLENGHELPISCHREHDSIECFAIFWRS